jgi:hypothetical protein
MEMTVHRSIRFSIHTSEKHIEFSGIGLAENETEKLVDSFSSVLTEGMAYSISQETDILAPFRTFFPVGLETQDTSTQPEEDHPENEFYQDTGIKYRWKKTENEPNGEWVPSYRLRYVCVNRVCNSKGTHFIPEGTKAVKCHNCKEKMDVREATSIGFPNKDSYNNLKLNTNCSNLY